MVLIRLEWGLIRHMTGRYVDNEGLVKSMSLFDGFRSV